MRIDIKKALLYLSMVLGVIVLSWNHLSSKFLKFLLEKNEPLSVGIIGGADGPTAIYVSTGETSLMFIIFGLILVSVPMMILILNRVRNKKK